MNPAPPVTIMVSTVALFYLSLAWLSLLYTFPDFSQCDKFANWLSDSIVNHFRSLGTKIVNCGSAVQQKETVMRKAKTVAIVLSVVLMNAAGASPSASRALSRPPNAADQPNAIRDLIVSKERQELDSLKAGDRKTFSDLIADDAVFLDPRGPATKEEVVKSTAELQLHEYSIEDVRFVQISAAAGLICYKLTEKATSHGKDMAGQVYVSATWVKRNDQWVCVFSQETPVK